ncbi:MAG: ATP-dependent sacrificial sulfur transferase LarE [Acidimicrobiia bacterium]|nr:ATP-dependent sacrificial sulfur transferase LarE [Acidimicrobiia bacterium]
MRLTSIPSEADDLLPAARHALSASLSDLEHLYVAFSGGADSAFLTAAAVEALGAGRVTAVTAISPSLPSIEHADCAAFTAELGLRWIEVDTDEMEQAAYRRNDGDRCFWCKDALMRALEPIVGDGGTVALGVNVDDLGEHRPGQRAAAEAGAVFPLVEAGFTKAMVREASRRMGLRTWDKPAAACLASRIPYGTAVSVAVLGRVERAERALRAMGFDELRVRHYDDTARIEVPTSRLTEVAERAEEVADAVSACGYRYVTLDLQGLRTGNLNQALA